MVARKNNNNSTKNKGFTQGIGWSQKVYVLFFNAFCGEIGLFNGAICKLALRSLHNPHSSRIFPNVVKVVFSSVTWFMLLGPKIHHKEPFAVQNDRSLDFSFTFCDIQFKKQVQYHKLCPVELFPLKSLCLFSHFMQVMQDVSLEMTYWLTYWYHVLYYQI